ncbi:MAG TPA: hypothetical protein VLQ90_16020, partial [Pyrinomonadaceae bacterium]|nr:hypothetical protein [Pyrinomonadaceae bacterium]
LVVAIATALFIAIFEPSASPSSSAESLRTLRLCGECFSPAAAGAEAQPTGVPARAARVGWSIGRAQQVSPAASRNAALIAATQDVLKETSAIRQLSILRPVQSSTQSRAEIERSLIKSLDEDTTPAEMHADEVTLKKLGLAPSDFQYRALMLRVLTEQVAGYYDPKTRQFHLADWIDLDGQKPIMAHELTHALQDQHFNLRRFEHWPKGDSDAELAAHALIEGDATLAMALYVANNPLVALAFLKSLGTTGMSSVELDKAPRALRESLLFPYQEGEKWVNALYKRGGWNEVSQAFTTLPQSTEQILHPEKYFAHEAPVKVALPDIAPLLNGSRAEVRDQKSGVRGQKSEINRNAGSAGILPSSFLGTQPVAGSADVSSAMSAKRELLTAHRSLLTGGWRRIAYDVQGEWGFYLILDQFLKSPAESRRAAAGWGGDRFAIYEGPQGEILIASLSVWDTENDAREFFDAYVKRTELRYPGAERLPNSDLAAPNSERRTVNRLAWRTNDGGVALEVRGNRILVVEGYSESIDRETLERALWK